MAYKILIAFGSKEEDKIKAEVLADLIRSNAYRLSGTKPVILADTDNIPQMCRRFPEAYAIVFDSSLLDIVEDVRKARNNSKGLVMVLVANNTRDRDLKRISEELDLVWIPGDVKNFHLRFIDLMRSTIA